MKVVSPTHETVVPMRVHHWVPCSTDTLGPGNRAIVWVQGCEIRCPGCILPEAWDARAGVVIDPEELAHLLLARPDIEGVTVSGGEPTEQPEAVACLLRAFKAAGRNTWLYTGRLLEDLVTTADPRLDLLLSYVDILVDGAFRRDEVGGAGVFRGSRNQRILSLTAAIPATRFARAPRRVEVSVGTEGLLVVGIPEGAFFIGLRESLRRRGIHVGAITGVAEDSAGMAEIT